MGRREPATEPGIRRGVTAADGPVGAVRDGAETREGVRRAGRTPPRGDTGSQNNERGEGLGPICILQRALGTSVQEGLDPGQNGCGETN